MWCAHSTGCGNGLAAGLRQVDGGDVDGLVSSGRCQGCQHVVDDAAGAQCGADIILRHLGCECGCEEGS